MPKASVNKQGDLRLLKNKVGLSEYWQVPSPANYPARPQEPRHSHFSARIIAAPNTGHNHGPLRFCENVSHWLVERRIS